MDVVIPTSANSRHDSGPDEMPGSFVSLHGLADALWARYEGYEDSTALDNCIVVTQLAVDHENDASTQAQLLYDLGRRFAARFELQGLRIRGAPEDLDRAIASFQNAVGLTPDDDPRQRMRHIQLATYSCARFERTGDIDDLDRVVTAYRCAVELTSDTDPLKPLILNNYGSSLVMRFKRLGVLEDIECSISAFRSAVALIPEDSPLLPACLSNTGCSLHSRFKLTGQHDDLEQAAALHLRVVESTADTDPDKPPWLGNLGTTLMTRYGETGQSEDLETAVSIFEHALYLTPDGHSDKPKRYTDLGDALYARFERTGNLPDIDQSISLHSRAVALTPDGHPDKPRRACSLGNSFFKRFMRSARLEDVVNAISVQRHVVELTPDDHPLKPTYLNNLGTALIASFESAGESDDIAQAISVCRRAIDLTPDGQPDKPKWFTNFGVSLRQRFEDTGELSDLMAAVSAHHRAVNLTEDHHPTKPGCLSNLGASLLVLFMHTGGREHIDDAIAALRRAVDLSGPDGCHDAPTWLCNLGSSLETRFAAYGELEDLEEAMSVHRRAVSLTPEGHADLPQRLSNLSASLVARFYRSNDLEYTVGAITAARRAIELTPHGHPKKGVYCDGLGNALAARFTHTKDVEDLTDAVTAYEQAVEMIPEHSPDKAALLSHLCQALGARFKRTHDQRDLSSAIEAGQRAIELAQDGHPDLFLRYNSMAICLRSSFILNGEASTLKSAIDLWQKAADTSPEGHPFLTAILFNLGDAQLQLFELTQTLDDFTALIDSFERSTTHTSGSPSLRFQSARRCALILSSYPAFSSPERVLAAYSRLFAILPEVVWLGYSIERRYQESSELGELVAAGVAAAIAFGATPLAVEWLEAGRALIWSQILSLRTPVNELEDAHPKLARSLRDLQQRLQSSVHASFAPEFDTLGSVVGISLKSAEDRHRALAIEYDKILKDIRKCPGFEYFLLPRRTDSLVSSLKTLSGPVVFINVHSSRCDAIIALPDGVLSVVPLPNLSLERAERLRRLWTGYVMNGRARERGTQLGGPRGRLQLYLKHIWTWIVHPILNVLDLAVLVRNGRLPHVTWCPTGPIMQLPLHAAGVYDEQYGPRAHDFVVSSYITSFSALERSRHRTDASNAMPHETLIVTQPSTPNQAPLPGTTHEGRRLNGVLSESNVGTRWIDDKAATVPEVRAVMKEYPWVHLACHGSQDVQDATQSAFHLFDGPLTLSDLMGTIADDVELAFLSACQTAVGDEKTPEESAHLAAGMLAVGFKGVIATMWSIQDADAPIIVEAYYRELLNLRSEGQLGKGETGAAYALHEATRVLREKVGEDKFMRWVPFVHFGA
ncbi:unnamed protein product [Peniophora sp. CBMAI 1063]|nr:unnamed protein product [Peniophora sp. CBMAI 1063]